MDLGASHAGGSSNSARLVTEIVYDAYGRVLAREDRGGTSPPDLRLGHKGLFFDRLDLGVADPLTSADTPRLEPGSTLLGFVRNRSLHTQWGRWLQRDPNATGMVVQRSLAYWGAGIVAHPQEVSLDRHYADGSNVLQYLESEPLGGSDPLGLFDFSITSLLGVSTTTGQMQSEWSQTVLDAGATVTQGVSNFFNAFAMTQYDNLLWALDWRQDDSDYSSRGDFTDHRSYGMAPGSSGYAVGGIKHHILTNKNFIKGNQWSLQFIAKLEKHGIKGKAFLNSKENTMMLETAREIKAHKGAGHSERYHNDMMEILDRHLKGLEGDKAREALTRAMDEMKGVIRHNPEIMRNPPRRR